jgi:MFS family permease
MALTAAALAVNSLLPHPRVWVLYVIAVIFSGLNGLQRPAREAIMPRILPAEHMPAVAALNSFRYSVGAIAGPAAGGVIFAAIGPFAAYCVDLSTFAFSIVTLLMIRALPPPVTSVRPNLRSIVDGLSYAKSRQVLMGTYVIDMIAMFFGMPLALFPAMAEGMGRPEATGFLYAAPAIGSLVTSLLSGHLAIVRRHGLAILISVVIWGLAIVALGFAHSLVLAMICLAIAGGADMVSGMFRQTIWNQSIPDHLRGRLAGIEMISYMSGPQLGNAEAGAVATLFSIRTSILSGGILCLVGTAVLVAVLPGFVTYDQSEGMKHKEEEEAARLAV